MQIFRPGAASLRSHVAKLGEEDAVGPLDGPALGTVLGVALATEVGKAVGELVI